MAETGRLISVTSRENKEFKGLKKLSLSRRERLRRGRILLEGARLVEAYRTAVGEPEMMILKRSTASSGSTAGLSGKPFAGRTVVLSAGLFREITSLAGPGVVMAVAARPVPSSPCGSDALLLEGIQDPGNMGTIVRSAAAAGFGTVALSQSCTDPWSPKSLRAGMGGHFTIKIEESADLLERVRELPGTVAALVPEGGESLFELDLRGRVAFLLGSEGQGLSAPLLSAAEHRVSIPMPGWSESLNAASAAAVALFETLRQRLGGKKVIDKESEEG